MRTRHVLIAIGAGCVAAAAWVTWFAATHEHLAFNGDRHRRLSIHGAYLGLSWALTGIALAWARPSNRLGWLLATIGLCQTLSVAAAVYGGYGIGLAHPHYPLAGLAATVGAAIWLPGLVPLANLIPALYPTGSLPGPRWRVPVIAAATGIGLFAASFLVSQGGYADIAPGRAPLADLVPDWIQLSMTAVGGALIVGSTVAIWIMSAVRLIRSRMPERAQLLWLFVVIVPMFVASFVGQSPVFGVLGLLIPVAIAVGVVRYRLLDIEIVIRRGVVYAIITAGIVAAYFALSAVAGAAITGERSELVVVATAVVVLALNPAREWLQARVDRVLYGERRDPLRAVERIADRVSTDDDLLTSVLSGVSAAVRASGCRVTDPDGRVVGEIGTCTGGMDFALKVGGASVGTLTVGRRDADFSAPDLRLLELLTPQVAVVTRALDLAERVEIERDRVLAATVAERERLRHDLHDGIGPSLAGIRLALQAVMMAGAADGDQTRATLVQIQSEVDQAVIEIRRVLDGLNPGAVEREGLRAALRGVALGFAPGVRVDLDLGELAPLSRDVEAAGFLIVREALTNVARHANTAYAGVTGSIVGDALHLAIRDEGVGFDPHVQTGIGLISMRSRAEALGGCLSVNSSCHGTTVAAVLPVQVVS